MRLRAATPDDAAAIAEIYAPFVTESAVSFETEPPDEAAMRARIEAGGGLYPWLVAEEGGEVVGYAYAARFRERPAYRFAVETTVYLRREACGRGLGLASIHRCWRRSRRRASPRRSPRSPCPTRRASALHERLGFVPAGLYRQVGWKLGRWHDVGLWQCPLALAEAAPDEPRPPRLADFL